MEHPSEECLGVLTAVHPSEECLVPRSAYGCVEHRKGDGEAAGCAGDARPVPPPPRLGRGRGRGRGLSPPFGEGEALMVRVGMVRLRARG